MYLTIFLLHSRGKMYSTTAPSDSCMFNIPSHFLKLILESFHLPRLIYQTHACLMLFTKPIPAMHTPSKPPVSAPPTSPVAFPADLPRVTFTGKGGAQWFYLIKHRPQSNFYFIEFPQNQVSSDFFQQDSGIDSFEVATASTKGNNVKKAKRRGRTNNGPSIPPTNNGRRPTRRKEEPAPTEPATHRRTTSLVANSQF